MNEGQSKFYGFIMGMVKDEKKADAEEILKKCFAAQDAGTFDKIFLMNVMPDLKSCIKEDGLPKLEQAMQHFASQL